MIFYRQVTTIVFLLVLGVVLAGCGLFGGNNLQTGDQILFDNESSGYLVCTDACRAQAQCGTMTTADGAVDMVFAHPVPATQHHNAALQSNQAIIIKGYSPQPLVRLSDNQEVTGNFYTVEWVDAQTGESNSGWVAPWCVADNTLN